MGKRTSDLLALTAILGGAGLGLGLTSLFARTPADRAPQPDESSVRVDILRRSIVVEPSTIWVSTDGLVTPTLRWRTRLRDGG